MNRSYRTSAVLIMLAISLSACGKRGNVEPPDGKLPPTPIWSKPVELPPTPPEPK